MAIVQAIQCNVILAIPKNRVKSFAYNLNSPQRKQGQVLPCLRCGLVIRQWQRLI